MNTTFRKTCLILMLAGLSAVLMALLTAVISQGFASFLLISGGALFLFSLHFLLAKETAYMATEKGYPGSPYFWYAFALGLLGMFMVNTLPDRNFHSTSRHTTGTAFNASLAHIANLKEQGVLSEAEAAKLRADVLANIH